MKIVANLDRRLVPSTDTTERYLRIQITAPDAVKSAARLPLNLALVIDRSGSMEGKKLEKAKEAAIICLRSMTSADRASIISYDDEVRVVSPSRVLNNETKNYLIGAIREIRSGGSTNLGGGWLTGAQEVANHQHEANYLNRAILLSDGLANVGIIEPSELEHHASELRNRGISTTTMGIGADFNEDLMERMAIKGGGHFYFIEHARQIPDFMERELGEVISTSARSVTVEIYIPAAVDASMLNTFENDRIGATMKVRFDDMIGGETRSALVKLTVRPGHIGTSVPIKVTVSYTDVATDTVRTVTSSEAVLTYATAAEAEREQANSAVTEDMALQEAARAREQALKYDAEGDYDRSAQVLAGAAAYVANIAPASPAAMAELDALNEEVAQAPGGFTSITRKAIHYAKSTTQQSRKR
jgi:Ca-activated chloride channel family protein